MTLPDKGPTWYPTPDGPAIVRVLAAASAVDAMFKPGEKLADGMVRYECTLHIGRLEELRAALADLAALQGKPPAS